jgi:hypothetical protein
VPGRDFLQLSSVQFRRIPLRAFDRVAARLDILVDSIDFFVVQAAILITLNR